MNQTHDRLDQLRRAVLLQQLQQRGGARRASPASTPRPIEPADRSKPLPLSFSQQRLWFLDQLDPAAGTAYHIPFALRLHGRLDRAALRAALDRLLARHESLRTRFPVEDGQPVQAFAPADSGFPLREHDLCALSQAQRDSEAARRRGAEAAEPFDLAAGPLIRGQLLRLAEEEHLLLLTLHHIVSDGWSVAVLVRELGTLYEAFSQGRPDPLPPLAVQYADYAAWQRRRLDGTVQQTQLAFWQAHLAGAPALLQLPCDRPRPAAQSHAGGRHVWTLPAPLSAQLRELSRRHGVTLFMTLLAGWSALMARLSGQDDVVIGTVTANRPHRDIEPLIGFFTNTLALRVRFDADPTVEELLRQVRKTTLDAHEHQDLPFEQVVEALQPARSPGHSPIFQVALSLDNTPAAALALPGLAIEREQHQAGTSLFDLHLDLRDSGAAIEATLTYATDLYAADTAARYAGHFQSLLAGMAGDAQARVGRLPLIDAQQRRQLLVDFNTSDAAFPHERLMHELFEAQASARPDAVAVVCG
ncbi:MAG TPA: condensation domain-containing protein, partial [Burkholderiaceae bacterium]|nr:condensation domain-containing protein [Burkholderiaceae bacterium]